MFRNTILALSMLAVTTPVLAEGPILPLDNLPDPDPLLLEHTIQLQRDIYTSALEIQYARNLDTLCKANPSADRCEGYEPGEETNDVTLPGSRRAPAMRQQPTMVQPIMGEPTVPVTPTQQNSQTVPQPTPQPHVAEISGSGADLTAILVLPSGERQAVRTGDELAGFGRVASVDRTGVTLIEGNSRRRLGGGR